MKPTNLIWHNIRMSKKRSKASGFIVYSSITPMHCTVLVINFWNNFIEK